MKNTFTNLKAARKYANSIVTGVVFPLPLLDGYVVVKANKYNPCAGPIVYQTKEAKEFLARRSARGLRKRGRILRGYLKSLPKESPAADKTQKELDSIQQFTNMVTTAIL